MASSPDWYYNSYIGEVIEMVGWQAAITVHSGIGWHGPFNSESEARNFYENGKAANPGWKAPVSSLNIVGMAGNAISSVGDKASAVVNAPGNALSNAYKSTVESVLGPIQAEVKIWTLRIGEVILGLVLLGVGLSAVTGNANKISSFVKGAGKTAITKGVLK